MQSYQRILCAVNLGNKAREIVNRGLLFARAEGAELAIASVVDDQLGVGDSESYPALTAAEVQRQTLMMVCNRLNQIAANVGATQAEILVSIGKERETLVEIASQWGANLVIVGVSEEFGLSQNKPTIFHSKRWSLPKLLRPLPFDVLTIETRQTMLGRTGRLVQSLLQGI